MRPADKRAVRAVYNAVMGKASTHPTPAALKATLIEALLQKVADDLAMAEQAHRETKAGATHEEAKPENDKDTRALEQSYLARGQAQRVHELREGLLRIRSLELSPTERAALGSLVVVFDELDEEERSFLLMPAGGGTKLADGVLVVTPESPWGRALLGASVGDSRDVLIADKRREFEVLRLA